MEETVVTAIDRFENNPIYSAESETDQKSKITHPSQNDHP